jgi:hypothetical protein
MLQFKKYVDICIVAIIPGKRGLCPDNRLESVPLITNMSIP